MKKLSSTQKAIFLALALILALGVSRCSPGYVLRAGIEEAKILRRRRPISDVISDPSTSATERNKLLLVLAARAFAEHQLGLAANESFTTYSWVDSDTLLMVVSGARKDKFVPYLWWFPIVGSVPYKGYFNFESADREAAKLEDKGYDASVRPSGAFSTLGWFNDPLLNTILRYSDVSLAETVVHEITHNSLYLAGQAGFNESFANFVGDRGAALFFCTREGNDDNRCKTATNSWLDNITFGTALSDLVARLEHVYNNAGLSVSQKVSIRDTVFSNWRVSYKSDVVPKFRTLSFRSYADQPLNNARLIGTRLYYEHLDLFEQVYQRYGGDLRASSSAIMVAARKNPKDPFAGVRSLLSSTGPR
ncbi:MAG TPA: aminopeptidase [Longimicrobiales bacterium]|nr:aminopeptidase [Longimicrobiales bacterium]